jgi:hypothetical protein
LPVVSEISVQTRRTREEGVDLRLEACGEASGDLIHIFSGFFGGGMGGLELAEMEKEWWSGVVGRRRRKEEETEILGF